MQVFFDNLTSIQWWLGVVLVGIAINLLSIFIKNRFDGYFSKISTWWRNKSEKRKKVFELEINVLRENQHELIMASLLRIHRINSASYSLLLSMFCFIIVIYGLYFISQPKIIYPIIFYKISLILILLLGSISSVISVLLFISSSHLGDKIRTARKNSTTVSGRACEVAS
jgi:hypothetical protein